jgi:hypothetical protein
MSSKLQTNNLNMTVDSSMFMLARPFEQLNDVSKSVDVSLKSNITHVVCSSNSGAPKLRRDLKH